MFFVYFAKTIFALYFLLAIDEMQNMRPEIPRCCPSAMANIMKKCWDAKPDKRPEMDEVVRMLESLDTSKGGGMIPEGQATGCFCFKRGP